ncbi:MAG: nucleotide sugar dehydrogenase [Legionellales bacterium]|nr:nucleotide sugar dehydrogenase [Legionellales bacterium]
MLKNNLLGKLKDKTALIGIVGLGYVGLPLALRYSEVGFKVLGFDIDAKKVDDLNRGQSEIKHISHDVVATAIHAGFRATVDFKQIAQVDAIILCVPTPLNKYREPDLSYVINTVENILPHLRKGQVLSLESTVYPGTTEEELLPRLQAKGFAIGHDYFLVYSPEREDPANPDFSTASIPKVCGGSCPACLEIGIALYDQIVSQVVPVSSTKAAEMTKLLENIHRAVNIGLVNEMKKVCTAMDVNIFEIVNAAATKPFGFVPYYPGPGIGGHCIPIDPFYLTWKAREYGIHTRFIELAGEINSSMPHWVIDKTIEAMNARGKPIKDSKMLILGIAYKKNVDDMRESPSLELVELLLNKGAQVDYSDPHVEEFSHMRKYADLHMKSVPLTPEILAHYDCVVIATAHKAFDWRLIKNHAQLIVDTRGVYYQESAEHIIAA